MALVFVSLAAFCPLLLAVVPTADSADTIEIARSYNDGGGYEWKGTGVPEEIRFKNERILAKGEHTYCCGFTFAVAMKAAQRRGLLRDKSADAIRTFQKEWYGSSEDKEIAEVQAAIAAEQLGIGGRINADDAKPGDFLQFWRANKSGHSVVFLGWVEERGRRVGFKYRSSQKSTDGIGDRTEYFIGAPGKEGAVDPKRIYFCRLNERP